MIEYEFESVVTRWEGDSDGGGSSWYFASIPEDLSDELRAITRGMKGGFGSIKVAVRIGDTAWSTSLFPSKRHGTYLLPVKQEVRRAEGIDHASRVTVTITL